MPLKLSVKFIYSRNFSALMDRLCKVFLKVSRKISLDLLLKISSIRKVMLPVP